LERIQSQSRKEYTVWSYWITSSVCWLPTSKVSFCATFSDGPDVVSQGVRRLEMHLDKSRCMMKWLIYLHVNHIVGLTSVCT